jgi:hypothetical protein
MPGTCVQAVTASSSSATSAFVRLAVGEHDERRLARRHAAAFPPLGELRLVRLAQADVDEANGLAEVACAANARHRALELACIEWVEGCGTVVMGVDSLRAARRALRGAGGARRPATRSR